jgi:hypothetical protein
MGRMMAADGVAGQNGPELSPSPEIDIMKVRGEGKGTNNMASGIMMFLLIFL